VPAAPHQQRPLAVGVQEILRLGETLDMFLDLRQRLFVRLVLAGEGRIELAEADFLPRFDEEFFAVVHEACSTRSRRRRARQRYRCANPDRHAMPRSPADPDPVKVDRRELRERLAR
jgi:hypothetical protein